jgi:hypothetical protein
MDIQWNIDYAVSEVLDLASETVKKDLQKKIDAFD